MTALLGLTVLAAGCGGSNGQGTPGSSSRTGMAQLVAYARCMRSHGLSDFPDPTTSSGGGAAISVHGGPGSDLNRSNPTFKAANEACPGARPRFKPPAKTASRCDRGTDTRCAGAGLTCHEPDDIAAITTKRFELRT